MYPRCSRTILFFALATPGAFGQSEIFGVDHSSDQVFRTDSADFVGGFTALGPVGEVKALDFDATASTLWGVDNDTLEYGTLDPPNGAFSVLGLLTGPSHGVTGIAAHPDGTTWYLSEYYDTIDESFLWQGDITSGIFTFVGMICSGGIVDISVDSLGNLYGLNISDDSLYSIDPGTGAGTWVGPLGHVLGLAQGMDFDWSDDTLYATLSGGVGGPAVFASVDVASGAGTVIQDTTPVAGAMEMALKVPAMAPVLYCFGDGSGTACPCGNPGTPDAGCGNSSFPGGARLRAGGAYYAVELRINHGDPNQPVLFFEGTIQVNGGAGLAFGDGLRCAGGSVTRLNTQQMDASGLAVLDGTVQENGGGASPGSTRTYQAWYRDPVGGACGSGFNLSNGVSITY